MSFDEAPRSGTVVVREGAIAMVSEGAAQLLGRTAEELLATPFVDLFVPEERARIADRYRRRVRGEPVPSDYEATVVRADGSRLSLALHVDREGRDVVVHYRDISQEMDRREHLQALATLGAEIQREGKEAQIQGRLRAGLPAIGIAPLLMQPSPAGVRVVWSQLPQEIEASALALFGRSLAGFVGRWSPFSRKVWDDGAAYTDDWAAEAATFVPAAQATRARELTLAHQLSRAIAVRIDERAGPRFYLVLASPWLRGEDLAAARLFAAQVAGALDAAAAIADLSRRLSDLTALHSLTGSIFANPPGDVPALLRAGCRQAAAALSCAAATAYLVEQDGTALRAVAHAGEPLDAGGGFPIERDRLADEAIRTRAPVYCPDVGHDEGSAMFGRTLAAPAMLAVPLVARQATRGVLYLADHPGRTFADAERALAQALAGELAVGLENAELYAAAQAQVRDLSLLGEMGRTLAASLDLEAVVSAGTEAALRLLDTDRTFLVLTDPDRPGRMWLAGGAGERIARLLGGGYRPSADRSGLTMRALVERRVIAVEDLDADPTVNPAHRDFGSRSALAAPLLVRGEPRGVLFADSSRPRRFSDADRERAAAVANQLAVAVENARLYSEARERLAELSTVLEVARVVSSTLDLAQVLDAGAEQLKQTLGAGACTVLLQSARGPELRREAHRGPPIGPAVFPAEGPSLVWEALGAGEPVRGAVGAEAPVLAMPLYVRDIPLGVVLVGGLHEAAPAPGELSRATAIASQLAVAVENARLYEDLRLSYQELERTQQQLIRKERLAALGELSAVVAHEVRNPLGVIFNSLGSLRRMIQPSGDAKLLLDIVGEEADRLNRIVGDLLDFARPITPVLKPGSVEAVVDEAVAAALGDGTAVVVDREAAPDLPAVPMDGRLLRQAVLNLAANAVQAMPRGGWLRVRMRPEGGGVQIELEDTGPGIPDEIRPRIFEPFFTTKASGTGLGLAVVKRIVEGHGGEISVSRAPSGGTLVRLFLPAAGPRPRAG